MQKRREWYGWLDLDRQDLNEVIDHAQQTDATIGGLTQQLHQLERHVLELSAIVHVQSQLLAEAGQLDPAVVDARVDALLQERRAPRARPPAAGMIRCVRCHRDVAPASTVMTADGAKCDPRCAP